MKVLTYIGILLVPSLASADMLQLKDGKVLNGTYAGGTIATVRFEVEGQINDYPVMQVAAITFGGSPGAPVASSSSAPVAMSTAPVQSAPSAATIPAGTPLLVSLSQELDSGNAQVGQMFSGTLVSPLTVGDTVVAPAGSRVNGTVSEVHGARRLLGRNASLSFSLNTLVVGSQQYSISTTAQSEDVKGKGMIKDAAGGAAKGAIFGAIANDDAGDGALGGMAAAAAGGVLRKPDQVVYKSGTILSFDLTQSLQLGR